MVKEIPVLNNATQQHVNEVRRELRANAENFNNCMNEARKILRENLVSYSTSTNKALMALTAIYDDVEDAEQAIFYDTIQSQIVTRLAAIEDKIIELFAHVADAADIIQKPLTKGNPQ